MKNWFSKKDRLLAGTIIASASMFGLAAPAAAQDDVAEEEEAIVVTGSRIARANLTSPTAVTTVDAQAIELSGEDNIAEILRGTPSFGVSGISSGNSNFFTSGQGVNTLQLRNLGEDRTLVLVNGRRYVSGLAGSSAVDFNTIPTDLLERVEVITGGASAVYGADALAGVVNMILRDDFEGIEYRYQYGESDYGDDVNHRFSVLAGGNFADGRGNAVVNVAFTQNGGVLARDRPNTQLDDSAQCATSAIGPAPNQAPQNCDVPVVGFSSFSEYGRFFDYVTGTSATCASGTGLSCVATPFVTATYGFNRQSRRRYTVPLERFMIAGIVNYEIGPSIEAFAETMYTHSRATSDIEPFPHSNSDLSILGIPCTNPYISPSMFAAACTGGPGSSIPFFRRMSEVGDRGQSSDRNTFRVLLGLRGDIAERYNWEAFYSFGRTEDAQRSGGQINVSNMREALDASFGDHDGNILTPDIFFCNNPSARAEGCVPVNLFGLGSITPAMAAYVSAPGQRQGNTQQEFAGASISGPLFEMPAGDAEFAVGVEWRRESSQDIPDALTQTGQNAGNTQLPTDGSYNVGEIFAEVEVPLLRDQPFAHELSVGGAFRWSNYNTAGETEAYTGRIAWAPVEWLRFRAQYAQAVRVPNIGELFAPAGENFAAVVDPCQGVTLVDDPDGPDNVLGNSDDDIDNNCRSQPEVLARINALGAFTLQLFEQQGTGGFTGGGNPNLGPESGETINAGFIINQDFGAPGNLAFSVDWYQIELTDTIRALGRQETIDLCYEVPAADFAANPFCASLVRQIGGGGAQSGELQQVNTSNFNEPTVFEFSGIDASIMWNFSLGDWLSGAPGDVSARLNWTHLLYENEDDGDGGTVGTVGSPEDKFQLGVIYNVGPWNFSWETTYTGDVTPSKTNPRFNYDVGEYVVHDLRIGWDVSESANLYFGSNNVFDEDAPTILGSVPGNTTGTDTNASVYDPIGRTWYAGIRLRY